MKAYRGVSKGFGGPWEAFFPHRMSKTAIVYALKAYRGVSKGFGGPLGSIFSPSKVKNSQCVEGMGMGLETRFCVAKYVSTIRQKNVGFEVK